MEYHKIHKNRNNCNKIYTFNICSWVTKKQPCPISWEVRLIHRCTLSPVTLQASSNSFKSPSTWKVFFFFLVAQSKVPTGCHFLWRPERSHKDSLPKVQVLRAQQCGIQTHKDGIKTKESGIKTENWNLSETLSISSGATREQDIQIVMLDKHGWNQKQWNQEKHEHRACHQATLPTLRSKDQRHILPSFSVSVRFLLLS